MKTAITILLMTYIVVSTISCSQKKNLDTDNWQLSVDARNQTLIIKKNDKLVLDMYSEYTLNDEQIKSKDYANYKIKIKNHNSEFGKGKEFQVTYTDSKYPTLIQSVFVYSDLNYLLAEIKLTSKNSIASNYLAPIVTDSTLGFNGPSDENRALFIPYDNDKWIRYKSHPLLFDKLTSYEVTAIFNNQSRNALVIGSVEHDRWKTGIEMTADSVSKKINSLKCFGGIANETTRDVKPHGKLKGMTLKSPKIFLGIFEDWREGLDEYALANAKISPPREWNKAVPFGWNSWGALQFNLNYSKAIEVSNFFKNNLQNNHFSNSENTVYMGLDSGWDKFTENELKQFVDTCKANGQKAAIYWTPFTDWRKDPDRIFKAAPEFKYEDIYLYANGKVQELDGAYALDPTHPAVESAMKSTAGMFRKAGFEYVKMDFMTHGAMEADRWYNTQISTGIEGYNYGMTLLDKYFHDMYITLSISPIFPTHYAQSRRIACDAWNKIKDTEYTLNALSYGWWQDKIYTFNDPDHIVLRDASDGENRARYISGIITGLVLLGDDFSLYGDTEAIEKAKKITSNEEINKLANGQSFIPLEGNGENSENIFYRKNKDGTLNIAIFNYSNTNKNIEIQSERLGLNPKTEYEAKEFWSNKIFYFKNKFLFYIPDKDVLILTLKKA